MILDVVTNPDLVVTQASWTSLYDVRANLPTAATSKSPTSPTVELQYRASVQQVTGEDWNGVSLTLSTASPTVGSEIPTLEPLHIKPTPPPVVITHRSMRQHSPRRRRSRSRSRSHSHSRERMRKRGSVRSRRYMDVEAEVSDDNMDLLEGISAGLSFPPVVVKEGGISLSYAIAGKSTITSDSSWHRVSIAVREQYRIFLCVTQLISRTSQDLDLPAELEWITVPRKLTSTFLRCRIQNSSTFELISGLWNRSTISTPVLMISLLRIIPTLGDGSVFIDGNFASKTSIPNVSPQETFTCSLGVDPSIRITYHPQKKISTSNSGGLMAAISNNKSNNVTTYRQRITLKNTRSSPVGRLIVQDQVPLAEDSRLKVMVHQPLEKALGPVAGPSNVSTSSIGSSGLVKSASELTLLAPVKKNIVARWAQKSDEKGGSGGSRQDGIIEWVCTDLMDTVDLELVYDVSAPADLKWEGL